MYKMDFHVYTYRMVQLFMAVITRLGNGIYTPTFLDYIDTQYSNSDNRPMAVDSRN